MWDGRELCTQANEESTGQFVLVIEHVVLYDVKDLVNIETRLLGVFWVIQDNDKGLQRRVEYLICDVLVKN